MIEIQDLKKSFGSQMVLKGVNLVIPDGQITVIIGASGSGKSVLLKHLIGLSQPDSGKILVSGTDIAHLDSYHIKNVRMRFGMLFQDGALFDSMNVYENIAFPLREHRRMNEEEIRLLVAEKLKQVNLPGTEKKMPNELSGGMRKRVGLARAIVLNPEIILYDEPTTGLDPVSSQSIDDLIVSTQKHLNGTTVVISHDIRATLRIANKVAMLHDGKIVAEGTPDDFLTNPNPIVRSFLDPAILHAKLPSRKS
ncbi:MAG: transporter related protein [Bacteriovoracaceae bacterium]|nr:transporter related protein [Bacteriovoracaceae bacterium]